MLMTVAELTSLPLDARRRALCAAAAGPHNGLTPSQPQLLPACALGGCAHAPLSSAWVPASPSARRARFSDGASERRMVPAALQPTGWRRLLQLRYSVHVWTESQSQARSMQSAGAQACRRPKNGATPFSRSWETRIELVRLLHAIFTMYICDRITPERAVWFAWAVPHRAD